MSDIDPLYNMCMECGFCERNCPSRNLTLTPRQRISLLREEQRLLKEGNTAMAEELKKGYDYYGVDTCAACSMCSMLCPLGIDTAQIAISMRKINPKGRGIAHAIYNNFSNTLKAAKVGATLGGVAGKVATKSLLAKISEDAHQITGLTPYVPETMPKANTYKLTNKTQSGLSEKCSILQYLC